MTTHAARMPNVDHPVYARLTASQHTAFERHTVLHELDRRADACPKALAAKVQALVERGVPYFAPPDDDYRAWAAKVAELWQRLDASAA
jgi:TRAP-type C4-dicarboxylate transport system substrate-binding protein